MNEGNEMNEVKKVIRKELRNGNVGVLFSKGYGAGWYSWHGILDLLFDPEVIKMVEAETHSDIIEQYCIRVYGDDYYYGGADGLRVMWIPEGTEFKIDEYDGLEFVVTRENVNWIMA